MPAVRVTLERLLHQQRQAIEALAHIGVTARQPNPGAARRWNHRCRLPFARAFIRADTVEAATDPKIRMRSPPANSISIRPGRSKDDDPVRSVNGDDGAPASGVTVTELNTVGTGVRSQSCRRQRNNWLA